MSDWSPQEREAREAEWDMVADAFIGSTGSKWNRVPCPLCERETGHRDKKGSLGLNRQSRGYHCFRCGNKGKLPVRFFDRLGGWDETGFDAVLVVPDVVECEPAEGYMPLYADGYRDDPLLEFGRAYLATRAHAAGGLRQDALAEAGVGCALMGRLRGRVIMPVFNYENPAGPWRGWVSRDTTGRSSRPYIYCATPGFREGTLYNEPALWQRTDKPVYVVEGTLDTLALWPDSVAVLGKPLLSQTDLLLRATRPVVICLDADAWQEGWMLALQLRHQGQEAAALRLPPKLDPDEIPRHILDTAAEEALRSLRALAEVRLEDIHGTV